MSKKLLLSIFCVFSSLLSFSQTDVYKGRTLRNGIETNSYFLLEKIDEKDLKTYLSTWLDDYGKLTEDRKLGFRLEKLKGNKWSEQLTAVEVKLLETKKYSKVLFYFVDRNNQALRNTELRDIDAIEFIEDFKIYAENQEKFKLASFNMAAAADDLKDAQKEFEKTKKSLEKNLTEQEKLGKKLDSSPELMAKALAEKSEIVDQIVAETPAATPEQDLKKASEKKEKEIQKIKKDAEKAESKLGKKEQEFKNLQELLNNNKRNVKALEAVLQDAEIIFRKLEKVK